MTKYLYADVNGEPLYVATYSDDIDVQTVPNTRRKQLKDHEDTGPNLDMVWLNEDDQLLLRPKRPSQYHSWNQSSTRWEVANEALQSVIAVKCKDVDALRDIKSVAPITLNGVLFDADEKSIGRVRDVLSRITRGDGLTTGWIGWRTFDNTMVWSSSTSEYVKEQLTALVRLLENRHQACLLTAWAHKDAISSLTTYEEIVSYDITANWP